MALDRSKLPGFLWRWNGALLVIQYPSLEIIDDPYERQLVLERLASLHASPTPIWLNRLIFWLIVVGSGVGGLATVRYVRIPGLTGAAAFMIPFMAGFLLVDVASFALWVAVMTWRLRPRVAEALRQLGRNHCPRCFYDLRGHDAGDAQETVCPECALRVPRLPRIAESGDGDRE